MVGRFISMDDVAYIDPKTIGGLNLFAYCNNNPVMNVDPTGNVAISTIVIGVIIGAAVAFGGTAVADYVDDGKAFNGSISVGSYVANTLVGGIIGGFLGGFGGFSSIGGLFSSMFSSGSAVTVGGGAVAISITGVQIVGIAVGLAGLTGILYMAKPNSGRIRFSDGTGIDPKTGKEFSDPDKARNFYKAIKDAIKKANWKKWLKGKGWYGNHLK